LSDVHINVFRVITGRSDHTHLLSINASSARRLATVLDALAVETWAAELPGVAGQFHTIVRNGTFREITP
jgi:hypothetical protein